MSDAHDAIVLLVMAELAVQGVEADDRQVSDQVRDLLALDQLGPAAWAASLERRQRKLAFLRVLAPHRASGLRTWPELLGALNEEEAAEAQRLLNGGTIEELLA